MELILKLPRDSSFIESCKSRLHELEASLHQQSAWKAVVLVFDTDPL
jgi:hypothetical protein